MNPLKISQTDQAPMIVTYTEGQLVALLKERDVSSFTYLYDHYSAALYGAVLKIVTDAELASDVLQETFLHIWMRINTYDPSRSRLFTWMLTIARNSAIDLLRSRTHRNTRKNVSMPDTDYFDNTVKTNAFNVDCIGLRKAVERLKPEFKVLIDLLYFKGYTVDGIAEIVSIPPGTVKTRVRSALEQLRGVYGVG